MSMKCVIYPCSYDTIADSEFTPVACLVFVMGDDVMPFSASTYYETSQELGNCPMGQREALLKEKLY